MDMSFKDLVVKNRSYRGYDHSRRVSREELLEMVDCARLAASSVNKQPLKYVLVYEPEMVDKVQPLTKWGRALPDMVLPHPGKEPTAFIVICLDKTISENEKIFTRDMGIVAQTILLAAVDMGLGGCMIGNFVRAEVSAALSLPEHLEPLLVVALGKPDEEIVLTDLPEDGDTNYYRDADDVHYVPKRALEDIVL